MYALLAQDIHIHMVQGTKIFDESEDEDTTDLHKCVAYILQSMPNLEESNVGWTSFGRLRSMVQLLHFVLCSDFSDWHYNVELFIFSCVYLLREL